MNKSKDNSEELILDENELAAGHEHCDIGRVSVSENHSRFVYEISYQGDEM